MKSKYVNIILNCILVLIAVVAIVFVGYFVKLFNEQLGFIGDVLNVSIIVILIAKFIEFVVSVIDIRRRKGRKRETDSNKDEG